MDSVPSQSESEGPLKPMRLGTRSCAECRRRKVKCVFPSQGNTCENCLLHKSRCTPQQGRHQPYTRTSQLQRKNLQQRLEGLEGIVRQVCSAVGMDAESSTWAEFETGASEALKRLRPASQTAKKPLYSSFDVPKVSISRNEQLNEAPLLGLFKNAMLLQDDEVYTSLNVLDLSMDPRTQACIESLRRLVPSNDDLSNILSLTSKYWRLWPQVPIRGDPSQYAEGLDIVEALSYITDCLDSDQPALVAKAALWMSLCIQQLPKEFAYGPTNLPAPLSVLLDSFLSASDTLLSLEAQNGGSIDVLEGLTLQSRFYLDSGKPQKSWFHIRHALNMALLMGLHRAKIANDPPKAELWTHIWQHDRLMSVLLGLPCGISETHPSIARHPTSPAALVSYGLAITAGHVTERNQDLDAYDYSHTLKLDQELQNYKMEVIDTWEDPNPQLPLEVLYGQQAIKIQFYIQRKFLHLPYMLRYNEDPQYANSRLLALQACRDLIKSYLDLRENCGSATIMCDVMDFQVFSASATLVIDLLSESSHSRSSMEPELSKDWALVQAVTRALQVVSSSVDCAVASQAAQLLNYLYRVHHGTYTGPELYEAVIPYFGRVKIRRPRSVRDVQSALTAASTTSADPAIQVQSLGFTYAEDVPALLASPSVEFSLHSVGYNSLPYPLSEEELGLDWSSGSDGESIYDWTQWFSMRSA